MSAIPKTESQQKPTLGFNGAMGKGTVGFRSNTKMNQFGRGVPAGNENVKIQNDEQNVCEKPGLVLDFFSSEGWKEIQNPHLPSLFFAAFVNVCAVVGGRVLRILRRGGVAGFASEPASRRCDTTGRTPAGERSLGRTPMGAKR